MCAFHKHLPRENILYCSERFHSRGLTGKKCTVSMTVGEARPDRAWRCAHVRQWERCQVSAPAQKSIQHTREMIQEQAIQDEKS